MAITLQLAADIEQKLRHIALQRGHTVEEYLTRLVEQSIPTGPVAPPISAEAWEAGFRAWAASHPPLPVIAADDRESIYGGRGAG
jgi:hypothetical protein